MTTAGKKFSAAKAQVEERLYSLEEAIPLIQKIKFEPDVPKRNALIRDALLRIRDEALFIPIHHQIRPWAMKPGVDTIHRSNDYFEARYTTVK